MSGGGFVKLPNALLLDSDVSAEILRAYMVLVRRAIFCSSDTFEMSGEQLGILLGRTRRQAVRYLADLQGRGLVAVDGDRGRNRANLITVLDPQETVFTGLHVARAETSMSQPSSKEVEEGSRQRTKRTTPLPSPVDNGGASRPPRPPAPALTPPRRPDPPAECPDHRGQPAHACRSCRADQLAERGPRF